MTLSALPMVLLGPFGGTLADRRARVPILVACDVVAGIVVLSLAGLLLSGRASTGLAVVWLIAVVAAVGCVRAFFQPAVTAAVPDLVPAARLAAANSLLQLSSQGSTVLGQALGGVLFRLLGAPLLFVADGASYLLSAASESFIRQPPVAAGPRERPRAVFAAYLRETGEGFAYLRQRPGLVALLVAASAVNFFLMPVFVLLPFYVELRLGAGAAWYGFLLSGLSAGSIAGSLLAGLLRLPERRRGVLLVAAFFAASVLVGLLGVASSRWLALGLLAAAGLASGLINVHVITLFQTATPPELRGRVLSLVIALAGAVTPLGMLVGGVLGDVTGMRLAAIFVGCGAAATATVAVATTRSAFRALLGGEGAGDGEGGLPRM
jgi:MFS family permease